MSPSYLLRLPVAMAPKKNSGVLDKCSQQVLSAIERSCDCTEPPGTATIAPDVSRLSRKLLSG